MDSPSTKLTSEEDAAVSALAATASVDAVADDDVKGRRLMQIMNQTS